MLRSRRRGRAGVAVLVGAGCLLAVLLATGLALGSPVGTGDNADGARLYCGAGLVPSTPDRDASWKGGVVLGFDRARPCPDPMPSSALVLLRLATAGAPNSWSLVRLGWLYAVLAAAVATVAGWAATAASWTRVVAVLPAVVPLADPDFARLFLSTYAEPAGLFGAFTLACGLAVITVTRRAHRAARWVGLALVACGGVLGSAAKLAYAPLAVVAALVCATAAVSVRAGAPRWTDRVTGVALAGLVLAGAGTAAVAASGWQTRHYPAVNAFNLTYTVLLTEIPGSAPQLGLPAASARHAGQAFYPAGPTRVPGADLVEADPVAAQRAAWLVLAHHPGTLCRVVGVAVQATQGRALEYLPSRPWRPGLTGPPIGTSVGPQGVDGAKLRAWLGAMRAPWWPSLVVALGALAGLAGLLARPTLPVALARLAGAAALVTVGIAVDTVLGDGYFEIAKHMWLAAYLVDLTQLALLGAVLGCIITVSPRSPRRSPPPAAAWRPAR